MTTYGFVSVTALIAAGCNNRKITSPVRLPVGLIGSGSTSSPSPVETEVVDRMSRDEFVRDGLLTPAEAAAAKFSYASIAVPTQPARAAR